MATAFITEYEDITVDDAGRPVATAQEPPITTQKVTYTTTSQSAALNDLTRFVRVIADAKAHFVLGSNPSATADDPFIAANTVEYFGVERGSDIKIAFYDGSS